MDALREVVQLRAGRPKLLLDLGDLERGRPVDLPAGLLQQRRDTAKPPLCSLVELSPQTAPLHVRRVDDPAARGRKLEDPRAHLRLEAGVRDRQPRRRGDGLDERLVFEHRLVVDEHGDRLPVVLDRRHRLPRSGPRQLDRTPRVVDVAPLLREPIAEDERAVAECAPELVAEGSGVGLLPEVDDQAGDDRLGPATAKKIDQKRDRQAGDDDVVGPEGRSIGVPSRQPLDRSERQHAREGERRYERRDPSPPGGTRGA